MSATEYQSAYDAIMEGLSNVGEVHELNDDEILVKFGGRNWRITIKEM